MTKPKRATSQQITQAREMYAEGSDDNIEVDNNACVSESEDGVWVQAWVWLAHRTDI